MKTEVTIPVSAVKRRKNTKLVKRRIAEKNLKVAVLQNGFPPCFDSEKQYADWLDSETIVHTLRFRKNPCEDCTSAYQSAMILQEKCVNSDFLVKN